MNIKHKKAFGKEVGGDLERQHASPRANGNNREREKCWEFWENTYLPQMSLPLSFLSLSSCGMALWIGPI